MFIKRQLHRSFDVTLVSFFIYLEKETIVLRNDFKKNLIMDQCLIREWSSDILSNQNSC